MDADFRSDGLGASSLPDAVVSPEMLQRWRRLSEVEGDDVLVVPAAHDGDDGERHATAKPLEGVAGPEASCRGGEGWPE